MLTKTKEHKKKKNDLDTNHSFSIPENIKKDINEKGFHLYNWIGINDIKYSIQRDFLKQIYSKKNIIIWILFFILTFLLKAGQENGNISENLPFILLSFKWILLVSYLLLIIYIIIIGIHRTILFKKNNNILITKSHILIDGKILEISKNKDIISEKIKNISLLFEEKIFQKSNLKKSISNLIKKIFKDSITVKKSNKPVGDLLFLLFKVIMHLILFPFVFILYSLGILFIWLFGIGLSIINKLLLIIIGHKITTINNNFEKIDFNSKELKKEKDNLSSLLIEAMKSNWRDSLLLKINSGIKEINLNAEKAIETNVKLKKEIKDSKYKEMFNFSIYNLWIKKQIYIPLKQIVDLLKNNLDKLEQNKETIEKQILETSDRSLQGPLVGSKTRTIMKIEDVEKHIAGINIYINKLK